MAFSIVLPIFLATASLIIGKEEAKDSESASGKQADGLDYLNIPTLGVPFAVGMLYDARSNQIIPSASLFERHSLEQKIREVKQPSTKFDILSSNSLLEIEQKLRVEGALTITLTTDMFGVTATGSAAFVNERPRTENTVRVTLFHNRMAYYKYIDMSDAKSLVMYQSQMDRFSKLATHVVTEVSYGANAFLYFDYEKNSTENTKDIRGHLSVGITKTTGAVSDEGVDEDTEVAHKGVAPEALEGQAEAAGSPDADSDTAAGGEEEQPEERRKRDEPVVDAPDSDSNAITDSSTAASATSSTVDASTTAEAAKGALEGDSDKKEDSSTIAPTTPTLKNDSESANHKDEALPPAAPAGSGIGNVNASLKVNATIQDEFKRVQNRTRCGFVGDYNLNGSPGTFAEASKVIRTLGNAFFAVPIRAKLVPITKLFDPKVDLLLAEIDESSITQVGEILEALNSVQLKIQTLLLNRVLYQLPEMLQRVRTFADIVSGFRNHFQMELSELLPIVRSQKGAFVKLRQVLAAVRSSPFKAVDLIAWIENKKEQIELLTSEEAYFLHSPRKLPQRHHDFVDIRFLTKPGELAAVIMDVRFRIILVLEYYVTEKEDRYLKDLEYRLKNLANLSDINSIGGKKSKSDYEVSAFDSWVSNDTFARELAIEQYRFFYFCQANSVKQYTKSQKGFVIECVVHSKSSSRSDTEPRLETSLLINGRHQNFKVPSTPRNVSVTPSGDGFEIKWEAPAVNGEYLVNYVILMKPVRSHGVNNRNYYQNMTLANDTSQIQREKWSIRQTKGNETRYFLPCLDNDLRTYFLKIRARTAAGETYDESTGCFGKGVPFQIIAAADGENDEGKIEKHRRRIIVENAATCSIRLWNKELDEPTTTATPTTTNSQSG